MPVRLQCEVTKVFIAAWNNAKISSFNRDLLQRPEPGSRDMHAILHLEFPGQRDKFLMVTLIFERTNKGQVQPSCQPRPPGLEWPPPDS